MPTSCDDKDFYSIDEVIAELSKDAKDDNISISEINYFNSLASNVDTALTCAIKIKADVYHIKKLLKEDKNLLYKRDKLGRTPLMVACLKNERQIIKFFLEEDNNIIHDVDKDDRTSAWYISYGDDKTLKLLIDNGLDINRKDRHDRNLLYKFSIQFNKIECLDLLFERGVEINNIDYTKRTILDYLDVYKYKHLKVIFYEYFLKKGMKKYKDLIEAKQLKLKF